MALVMWRLHHARQRKAVLLGVNPFAVGLDFPNRYSARLMVAFTRLFHGSMTPVGGPRAGEGS